MMYLGMDVFKFMCRSLSFFCLLINVFHYISEVFSHYIFEYFFSAILSSETDTNLSSFVLSSPLPFSFGLFSFVRVC